jgi:hypothetical protein
MATKKSSRSVSVDTPFYTVFALQRVALLFSLGGAALYWMHLVATAMNTSLLSGQGDELMHPGEFSSLNDALLNNSMRLTLVFSLTAIALTLVLSKFRQKDDDTVKTVMSGLVIALFCMFVTAAGESLYRSFLSYV